MHRSSSGKRSEDLIQVYGTPMALNKKHCDAVNGSIAPANSHRSSTESLVSNSAIYCDVSEEPQDREGNFAGFETENGWRKDATRASKHDHFTSFETREIKPFRKTGRYHPQSLARKSAFIVKKSGTDSRARSSHLLKHKTKGGQNDMPFLRALLDPGKQTQSEDKLPGNYTTYKDSSKISTSKRADNLNCSAANIIKCSPGEYLTSCEYYECNGLNEQESGVASQQGVCGSTLFLDEVPQQDTISEQLSSENINDADISTYRHATNMADSNCNPKTNAAQELTPGESYKIRPCTSTGIRSSDFNWRNSEESFEENSTGYIKSEISLLIPTSSECEQCNVQDKIAHRTERQRNRPRSAFYSMTSSSTQQQHFELLSGTATKRPQTAHGEKFMKIKSQGLFDTTERVTQLLNKIRQNSTNRKRNRPPTKGNASNGRPLRRVKSAGATLGAENNLNGKCSGQKPWAKWNAASTYDRTNDKAPLERFRRAVRLVGMVLHCLRAMMDISDGLTTRTAVEMQWYELHVSKEAKKLAFDASLFSRERAFARVPKWARLVMNKPAEERSETDCRRLHAMLRGLKNFDKFTEEIQMAMCRAFQYYKVESMRVILRKGHIGVNFYFIYSGSVFINVEDTTSDGGKFVKTEVILGVGDSFGEIALLKDVPRGATVTSRETCELLVVDKEVFARVCPRIFDIELEQKVNFTKSLDLFSAKYWSDKLIRDICFEAQIQEYKTNKVIVKDSSKEEWLYINMKGSCRVIKCLWLHDQLEDEEMLKDDLTIEYLETLHDNGKNERGGHPATLRHPHHSSSKGKGHVTFREQSADSKDSENSNSKSKTDSNRKASVDVRKARLLDSMALEYIKSPDSADEETPELDKRLPPKQRRLSQHGIMSLTSYMREKREDVGGREEFVYLDIGSLNAGDVFDLTEMLVNSNKSGYRRSCLVLVSSGVKVLRMKKQSFMSCITRQGLEHAKHLAKKQAYPSNAVLIKSFKEKRKWEQYKNLVLSETVLSFQHLKRIQHLHNKKVTGMARRQETRVLRRLKQDRTPSEISSIRQDSHDPDRPIVSELESRMLVDADILDTRRELKPVIPEVTHRRKSWFGAKTITVTQGSRRTGDFKTELSTALNLQNMSLETRG